MKSLAIIGHVAQTFSSDHPLQCWVELPLGAKPLIVAPHAGGGFAVIALGDPAAMKVQCPLVVFPVGQAVDVPLGMKIGDFLGNVHLGADVACVFRGSPWPTTALEAVRPEGNG